MATIKIRNRHGQIVDHDDREIVPDGAALITSLFAMDAIQTEIASSARVTDAPMLTDSLGRPAGSRPGYVFNRDSAGEAQARQAHLQMCKRNSESWHSPGATISDSNPGWPGAWEGPGKYSRPQDRTLRSSPARLAYIEQLQNAYKSGGTGPASDLSTRLPASEWKDRVPKELPADVKLDARDPQQVRDASWTDLVARTANAWKTPPGAPR